MRTEFPTQVHPPRRERIDGRWYHNTGKFGTIERVSCFRVCVAGGLTGVAAFFATAACPPIITIAFTISGIYEGMKMGRECTIKEKGMKKCKILSQQEYREAIEEENLQDHLEKHSLFKTKNVFKLIWP